MNDHYYTRVPQSESKPVGCEYTYRGISLSFQTDAAKSLNPGGALYLVIRKQQGAESCMKYLQTLYGSVEKLDKSGGFWVLKAMKNEE